MVSPFCISYHCTRIDGISQAFASCQSFHSAVFCFTVPGLDMPVFLIFLLRRKFLVRESPRRGAENPVKGGYGGPESLNLTESPTKSAPPFLDIPADLRYNRADNKPSSSLERQGYGGFAVSYLKRFLESDHTCLIRFPGLFFSGCS